MAFIKVYTDVLHDKAVPYLARVQYCNLFAFRQNGKCYPTIAKQAARIVLTGRQVRRLNNNIEAAGWISRQRRRRTSTVYTLNKEPDGNWVPIFYPCTWPVRAALIHGQLWRMQYGWSRRNLEDYPTATPRYLMEKLAIPDYRTFSVNLNHLKAAHKVETGYFSESSLVFRAHIDTAFDFRVYDEDGRLVQDNDAMLDETMLSKWGVRSAQNST